MGEIFHGDPGDSLALPADFAAIAPGAEIGAPFELPLHRGDGSVRVAGPFCGRNRNSSTSANPVATFPVHALDLPRCGKMLISTDSRKKGDEMPDYLRLEAFRRTPLVQEPFQHLIVSGFISPKGLAAINADYPEDFVVRQFPGGSGQLRPEIPELARRAGRR